MSRKNATKRLALTLARNHVEPTQPGLLAMIRGLRLRPRAVRRAMMRLEGRATADAARPWTERWRAPKTQRMMVLSRNEYNSHLASLDRAAAARAKLQPLPATRRQRAHRKV